ncbi:alanine racemase [Acinetobacter silvestris]|uniref:Alanine racemase n=1 Tax=Acinetobacter silvestris TaxID=1977882 RepID=A0A1Y3CKP2_9GAMM|nr:alanine racemase [Acinetobacter silvestris]OTG67699.1 alanine racemase [Acinetobacter silvestris]
MSDIFFEQLNYDLKQVAVGLPQLIVDQQALEQNIQYVKVKLLQAQHLQPRLVVKSLACLNLLKLLSEQLHTQRFMLFHLPQLHSILENFIAADVLFGKPMPVSAVSNFYQQYPEWAAVKIQWLVDTEQRILQYLAVAQQFSLQLQINLEIDVGLHRGGIQSEQELIRILNLIQNHPQYLSLSGLMGYDAHVTKIPKFIKKPAIAYRESQAIYLNYKELIRQRFPHLYRDDLCFNGGGSPSFHLHVQQSICNDLSFGSMLLKPSDFDLASLAVLQTVLWIATPVLKVLPYTQLPGMPVLNKLPHSSKALFVYGGYWMANYVYPQGSHPHRLYGRSANQELVNVPKNAKISVDDYVFLRPTQSEAIIPQFSKLYCYKDRAFEAWETFRE